MAKAQSALTRLMFKSRTRPTCEAKGVLILSHPKITKTKTQLLEGGLVPFHFQTELKPKQNLKGAEHQACHLEPGIFAAAHPPGGFLYSGTAWVDSYHIPNRKGDANSQVSLPRWY